VAEHLGLPFVTVCNALAINRDPISPPPFTPWQFKDAWWATLRNRAGYFLSDRMTRPITRVVADYRAGWKLPALRSPDDSFSTLAQICQMPREFDFPRTALPECFHYVGPIRGSLPNPIPFPWERLDGRPLVYASLGTLQNNREPLFRCFAAACEGLDVQLVISHGGGLSDSQANGLPGDPLVVSYAPQYELLARAALTITHAGLNTVLDSVANGVPVVTVPITYEQPAIARRVEWTGAGRTLSLNGLTPQRMKTVVSDVLANTRYRRKAGWLADAIRQAGGIRRAVDIVESCFTRSGTP
jgi:MGT family glycosyltransferase